MGLSRDQTVKATYGDAFHYSEEHTGRHFAKVMPGHLYVTTLDEFIATTLGSCVAVVLRDSEAGVAGMNHYLLPEKPDHAGSLETESKADQDRYGNQAMLSLIEGMLRCGARKGHIQSKVFGGGQVLGFSESIGTLNAAFAKDFLLRAGIPILASDVGGTAARKIILEPSTGQVRVLKLADRAREQIASTEKRLLNSASADTKVISGAWHP